MGLSCAAAPTQPRPAHTTTHYTILQRAATLSSGRRYGSTPTATAPPAHARSTRLPTLLSRGYLGRDTPHTVQQLPLTKALRVVSAGDVGRLSSRLGIPPPAPPTRSARSPSRPHQAPAPVRLHPAQALALVSHRPRPSGFQPRRGPNAAPARTHYHPPHNPTAGSNTLEWAPLREHTHRHSTGLFRARPRTATNPPSSGDFLPPPAETDGGVGRQHLPPMLNTRRATTLPMGASPWEGG